MHIYLKNHTTFYHTRYLRSVILPEQSLWWPWEEMAWRVLSLKSGGCRLIHYVEEYNHLRNQYLIERRVAALELLFLFIWLCVCVCECICMCATICISIPKLLNNAKNVWTLHDLRFLELGLGMKPQTAITQVDLFSPCLYFSFVRLASDQWLNSERNR